jgi:hypothetical protein
VDAVTVTSDSDGKFVTTIRVATGVPAQTAVLKVTDVATGAYSYRGFTINTTPSTANLTVIPNTISLTGPDDKTCGFGSSDVLVFDGVTPYQVFCPDPRTGFANPTSSTQPGKFTINVGAAPAGQCLQGVQCIVQDNTGARTVVTINTSAGAAAPTPPALTVSPNAVTLTCGASGAVTVVGGSGTYSANSTSAVITAVVAGNTVTITRHATPDPAGGPFPPSTTVSITDGASIATVTVTAPAAC